MDYCVIGPGHTWDPCIEDREECILLDQQNLRPRTCQPPGGKSIEKCFCKLITCTEILQVELRSCRLKDLLAERDGCFRMS
jgi:hypothetical protein